jgi:hypothetical protein
MRKLLTLGAVLAIVPSMFFARAAVANDAAINAIDCDTQQVAGAGPEVHNPFGPGGLTVPPLGQLVGGEDPCAELYRTLVFVGTAVITNGVNFAGTGNGGSGGTYDFIGVGAEGPGLCVMVSWSNPADSSGVPTVADCTFQVTNGTYTDPDQPNPVIHGAFGDPADGGLNPVLGPVLKWDPSTQASCFNSSGEGIATFTSNGLSGAREVWSSDYHWTNSLDNLRGDLSGTRGPGAGTPIADKDGSTAFEFDAKVQTGADTLAAARANAAGNPNANVHDLTAAGCLEKNVNNLTAGTNNAGTGLNYILVVGTATWKLTAPQVL